MKYHISMWHHFVRLGTNLKTYIKQSHSIISTIDNYNSNEDKTE